jgi:hypothetical protein
MKAKPKKLKTPGMFLKKKETVNQSPSSFIQTTKRKNNSNVSELVAKWSKDNTPSGDRMESKLGQVVAVNKLEGTCSSDITNRKKTKKILPCNNIGLEHSEENALKQGESLSFLNDMLG